MHPTPPRRMPYIDGLRGIAASYVVAYHMVLLPTPFLPVPGWLRPAVMAGGSGVTLFFALSAFTLCMTSRARAGEDLPTIRFYLRRFFRIAPLYYCYLAYMLATPAGRAQARYLGKSGWFMYLTFTYNLKPGMQEALVPASWTLGVEMPFYLAFPILFRTVRTGRRAVAFFALSLLAAAAFGRLAPSLVPDPEVSSRWVSFGLPTHLPAFAAGMVAYFALGRLSGPGRAPARLGGCLAASGLAGVLAVAYLDQSLPFRPGHAYAVAYAAIILGLGLSPARVLAGRLWGYLGELSYSIYLAHPHVIMLMIPAYRLIRSAGLGDGPALMVCLAATMAVAVPFAHLTYRAIERPGIAAGSALLRGFPRAAARAALA